LSMACPDEAIMAVSLSIHLALPISLCPCNVLYKKLVNIIVSLSSVRVLNKWIESEVGVMGALICCCCSETQVKQPRHIWCLKLSVLWEYWRNWV
jgi:hypothetical protein